LNSEPRPEPSPSTENEKLREGVSLFNRGEFFECHEILEAAWLDASGDDKIFLQGLIQLAVSFYHLRRGNFTGAGRLLRAAREKLAGLPPAARPIELGELLNALRFLPEQIESGAAAPETPAPPLRML